MKTMRSICSNGTFGGVFRGFTVMEVVIALLVTAVTIPLLLGALGASAQSLRHMAADTTSAWIARDACRHLRHHWENAPSITEPDLDGHAKPALVLLYTHDATLLTEGSEAELNRPCDLPEAFFVVALYAGPHVSENGAAPELPLAEVSIHIAYPAKAFPADRERLYYQTIRTTKGSWK